MLETQETTNCVPIIAQKRGWGGREHGYRTEVGGMDFRKSQEKNGTDGISGASRLRIFWALSESRDRFIIDAQKSKQTPMS